MRARLLASAEPFWSPASQGCRQSPWPTSSRRRPWGARYRWVRSCSSQPRQYQSMNLMSLHCILIFNWAQVLSHHNEFTIFALLCTYCWSVSPKQALSWSSLSQSYTFWPRPSLRPPLIHLWIHWKYLEQLHCDSNEKRPLITLDWMIWMASSHGMKLSDLYPREGRDMKILKKSYYLKILII